MIARTFLTAVVAATLILSGFLFMRWSERADAFAGRSQVVDATATLTPPPGPDTPTPRSTATPVDSAYAPIIFDTVSTATTTPTATIWLTSTAPPLPRTPTATPVDSAYAPIVFDTVSTATFAPTATATIPPDATPTIWLTHTPPPF